MVKVDLKILDSTTANDVTATKTINDNFEALQNAVEDSLSRSGKVPNYMQTDLDLNHNKLINLADPKEDRDAVTLKYVKDTIGDAKGYADKAEAEAIKANKTVEAARAYLQNSVDEARIWAKEAEESVSEAKEYANDAESGANIASASAARAQESALEAMSAKEYAEQAANNASIVVAEVKDDVIANTSEIAELKEIVNNIGTGGGSGGGSSITVDAEMSDTSENPVQNKVVKAYIDTTEQDIISGYMDSDSDLQLQINGQATVLAEVKDDVMSNMSEIADIKGQLSNIGSITITYLE